MSFVFKQNKILLIFSLNKIRSIPSPLSLVRSRKLLFLDTPSNGALHFRPRSPAPAPSNWFPLQVGGTRPCGERFQKSAPASLTEKSTSGSHFTSAGTEFPGFFFPICTKFAFSFLFRTFHTLIACERMVVVGGKVPPALHDHFTLTPHLATRSLPPKRAQGKN